MPLKPTPVLHLQVYPHEVVADTCCMSRSWQRGKRWRLLLGWFIIQTIDGNTPSYIWAKFNL